EKPAEVTGIEIEPQSQRTHFTSLGADLPQNASFAEGSVPSQEVIVQGADALGYDAVEPSHLGDHCLVHSLTLVREWKPGQDRGRVRGRRRGPSSGLGFISRGARCHLRKQSHPS